MCCALPEFLFDVLNLNGQPVDADHVGEDGDVGDPAHLRLPGAAGNDLAQPEMFSPLFSRLTYFHVKMVD